MCAIRAGRAPTNTSDDSSSSSRRDSIWRRSSKLTLLRLRRLGRSISAISFVCFFFFSYSPLFVFILFSTEPRQFRSSIDGSSNARRIVDDTRRFRACNGSGIREKSPPSKNYTHGEDFPEGGGGNAFADSFSLYEITNGGYRGIAR